MSQSEVSECLSERLPVPLSRPSKSGLRSVPCEARVQIDSLDDIVAARRHGRELAAQLGFSNCDLTLIATAIFEIARNALQYAKGGNVIITAVKSGTREGVKIVVIDRGPGIADLSQVMRDGYSTGKGLGMGLPGARRLMDEFEINSEIGIGTTVTMRKWAA